MILIKKVFITISFLFMSAFVFGQDNLQFIDSARSDIYFEQDLDSVAKGFINTSIRLRLPKGFTEFRSDEISGYMNTATASSIIAMEYDSLPYVGYYERYTDSAFINVSNAIYVGSQMHKTKGGKNGKFYFFTFYVNDTEINRILYFAGDTHKTIYLQANYPAVFDTMLRQAIIHSFLTAEYK